MPRAFLLAANYANRSRRYRTGSRARRESTRFGAGRRRRDSGSQRNRHIPARSSTRPELLDRGSKKYPANEAIIRAQATLARIEDKPEEATKIIEAGLKTLPASPRCGCSWPKCNCSATS